MPTDAPTFDLQSHSRCSDGELAPAEVVERAAAAGVQLLALSDHDTVDGVAEAAAAGRRHGVRVVPAAELSAVHAAEEDLHVLGYLVDPEDADFAAALADARADRGRRAERMIARMRELGWTVDEATLDARRAQGLPIGRPHLAQAAFNAPENSERLRAEGLEDFSALLVAYLIPGAPAYMPRTSPTVPEAIDLIHAAGGVAVWAHPFWDIDDPDEVLATLEAFAAQGLDGVEAFYATHDADQARLLHGAAGRLGLLTTGSADFHGPGHRHFGSFRAFSLHGLEPNLGPIADV